MLVTTIFYLLFFIIFLEIYDKTDMAWPYAGPYCCVILSYRFYYVMGKNYKTFINKKTLPSS